MPVKQINKKNSASHYDLNIVHELNHKAVACSMQGQFAQAIALLQQAINLAPAYASSHNNLGGIYAMCDMLEQAALAYEKSIFLDPDSAKTHFNLANIYRKLGKNKLATKHLKRTLYLDPQHHSASHILAAAEGRTTTAAPEDYVKRLFDQYAASFETALVQQLAYVTPQVLCQALLAVVGENAKFDVALDLGCGTGLAGQVFHPYCQHLTGVDLSGNMLEKAQEKQIYADLHCLEMVAFLERSMQRYNLFIAADSLIYCGDLSRLFAAIKKAANVGGIWVFSIELYSGEAQAYVLQETGRYAHAVNYIEQLCQSNAIKVLSRQSTVIRKEQGNDVLGMIFVTGL